MKNWLTSNAWQHRLLRTLLQVVIGFLLANIDLLVSGASWDAYTKSIIVAATPCILSPIMAALGGDGGTAQEAQEYLDLLKQGKDDFSAPDDWEPDVNLEAMQDDEQAK